MADNNLTISIGADTSKLSADLAIAQAQVRQFGSDLRAAAKESLTSGDTSQVATLAQRYDGAVAAVSRLKDQTRGVHEEHVTLGSRMREAFSSGGAALAVLGERFAQFREGVNGMVERVFPHFKEVLALTAGAAVYELIKQTGEAAQGIRDIENESKALGLSGEQMEGAEFIGAQFGLGGDEITRTLGRMTRALGTMREEGVKLGADVTSPITTLRGNMKNLADMTVVARGGVHQLNESLLGTAQVARGGVHPQLDMSKLFLDIANNPNLDQLGKLEEMAKRLDALPDPMLKAEAASKTMGRSWAQMLPAILAIAKGAREAGKSLEEAGITIQHSESEQAHEFLKARAEASFYFEALKRIVFGSLGEAFVPFFREITILIGQNIREIRTWASETGKYVADVARDFVDMFKGTRGGQGQQPFRTEFAADFLRAKDAVIGAVSQIGTVLSGLMRILDGIARYINSIFGTHLTGMALGVILVLGRMTGAFTLLAAGVRVAAAAFSFFLLNPVGLALTAIGLVALTIYQNWDAIGPVITELWQKFQQFGAWIQGQLGAAFQAAWGIISGVLDTIGAKIDWLIQKAKDLLSAISGAMGGNTGGSTDQTGTTQFASGGHVRGPGTGTSDSILSWLSNGEFVVNAASTAKNLPLLHAINSGTGGYAMGGLVHRPLALPAFAGGGAVGRAPVHLHLGGREFQMHASESVAGALASEASAQQMRSGGSKPTWYGR